MSIPVKHAAEAEQYGLKIRHLVSPIRDHSFPWFRDWTILEDKRYDILSRIENTDARLGLIGTVGFVALLGGFFIPRLAAALSDDRAFSWAPAGSRSLPSCSATVGGFGSLFNLLVSSDIRAYNRVTPFIAFFSLIAVALIADRLLTASASSKNRRWAAAGAFSLILFHRLVRRSAGRLAPQCRPPEPFALNGRRSRPLYIPWKRGFPPVRWSFNCRR